MNKLYTLILLVMALLPAGCAGVGESISTPQTPSAGTGNAMMTATPTTMTITPDFAPPPLLPVTALPTRVEDVLLAEALDAVVRQFADTGRFMGAVLVAQDGRVLLSQGYGAANLQQNEPNTPATQFRIGSLTKQFTAAAILQLQDAGRLSVQDSLNTYLPDYPGGSEITLHQLLRHTSGVPEHVDRIFNVMATPFPVDDLIGTFSSLPADFPPGNRFAYSNSNYVLLGKVIEVVSGQPYAAFIQEHIFDPLHMAASGYGGNEIGPGQATGYASGPGGTRPGRFVDMSIPYAAGALVSTVEDLYVWDRALRGDGLLSPAGREMMFTPGQGGYGYGWFIENRPAGRVASHAGSIFGYRSFIQRGLDQDALIVVLSNVDAAPVPDIAAALQAALDAR